jgi:serine/threonine protein phosphatase PrpC
MTLRTVNWTFWKQERDVPFQPEMVKPGPMLKVEAVAKSEQGVGRSENMDLATVVVISPSMAILILADGMGGHVNGALASQIAVEVSKDSLSSFLVTPGVFDWNTMEPALRETFDRVNKKILEQQALNEAQVANSTTDPTTLPTEKPSGKKPKMGTTLTVLVVVNGVAYFAHAGDSRAYLFRGDYVRRLTKDHLWIVDKNGVAENMAKTQKGSNKLSRSMGSESFQGPDVNCYPLEPNDRIVLTSDGVSQSVLENRMADSVFIYEPSFAATTLLEEAKSNGSTDDRTAIVAKIGGSTALEAM